MVWGDYSKSSYLKFCAVLQAETWSTFLGLLAVGASVAASLVTGVIACAAGTGCAKDGRRALTIRTIWATARALLCAFSAVGT